MTFGWRNLQGFGTVKFLLVSLDRGWILVQRSDEFRKIQSKKSAYQGRSPI